MKVLITGANGFLGTYLANYLENHQFEVFRGTRQPKDIKKNVVYGDLTSWKDPKSWENILKSMDCVIHCAGKAHRASKDTKDELQY